MNKPTDAGMRYREIPFYNGMMLPTAMVLCKQGCLVIFFMNFLALIISADVADPDSGGLAAYAIGLVAVNIFFVVLSIWWNTWATIKAMFSQKHVQVCMFVYERVCVHLCMLLQVEHKWPSCIPDRHAYQTFPAYTNKFQSSAKLSEAFPVHSHIVGSDKKIPFSSFRDSADKQTRTLCVSMHSVFH